MDKKKTTIHINCDKLTIGMNVVKLDQPWVDSPFPVHGFRIKSQTELQKLQQHCNYVYISNNLAAEPKTENEKKSKQEPHAYNNKHSFQQALPLAKISYQETKCIAVDFLKNLRLGQSLDTASARKAVKQCVNSIIDNQEAMLWLSLLKNVDEYTALHSLNVGLLSIILGRAEGLSREKLELVGLCGLLHDMGKSKIPLDTLNKEGAFSDDDFATMKTHTTLGYEILSANDDLSPEIANAAHNHHERLNGQGYPRSLHANKISYFTRIVTIADTYDAITSRRVYSPAKTSLEALRILIGAKGSHFDTDLVDRFVECIGIYPAGSVAELSSGEIAIVLPSPHEQRNTPLVLIVRGSNKKTCSPTMINLSQGIKDSRGKLLKINHLLSDDAFGIKLSDYHNFSQ